MLQIVYNNNPVGKWCQNDIVSTSMRRHDVASTLIGRHFYVMFPLGKRSERKLEAHLVHLLHLHFDDVRGDVKENINFHDPMTSDVNI